MALFFIFIRQPVIAKELIIAVGLALPPYVIAESNTGMELDIVREALKVKGYHLKPRYLPFVRVSMSLQETTVDGAMTLNESSGITTVYYTNSHITYQNVAVTLKKNHYTINTINDLRTRKIVAFQSATKYLGNVYRNAVKSSRVYREQAKQELQIAVLFSERTEVIVLDINIFKYYRQNTKKIDIRSPVTIHYIFPATHYKVAFIKSKIRDAFNEGLRQIQKSGRYEKIISKYIK